MPSPKPKEAHQPQYCCPPSPLRFSWQPRLAARFHTLNLCRGKVIALHKGLNGIDKLRFACRPHNTGGESQRIINAEEIKGHAGSRRAPPMLRGKN
jgi:hypothetical protein